MNYIKKIFSSYWGLSLICILITGIILSAKTILDIDVGFHLRGGGMDFTEYAVSQIRCFYLHCQSK